MGCCCSLSTWCTCRNPLPTSTPPPPSPLPSLHPHHFCCPLPFFLCVWKAEMKHRSVRGLGRWTSWPALHGKAQRHGSANGSLSSRNHFTLSIQAKTQPSLIYNREEKEEQRYGFSTTCNGAQYLEAAIEAVHSHRQKCTLTWQGYKCDGHPLLLKRFKTPQLKHQYGLHLMKLNERLGC